MYIKRAAWLLKPHVKGSFVAKNSIVLPVPIMVHFIVEHAFKSNSSIQIGNIKVDVKPKKTFFVFDVTM